MPQLFFNNARATLATAIDDLDISIEISEPVNLPTSLGENEWFLLTLFADTTRYGENIEVVRVTGVSGKTLTVDRGFEGDPVPHSAGERIEARPTAATLDRIQTRIGETSLVAKNAPLDDRLRLDGLVYQVADYPELGAMFPTMLPAQEVVSGTPSLSSTGHGAAFSPDGSYLAVAHSGSPYLTVIDTTDWSVVSGTPSLSSTGRGAAFSPDGSYLAVAHSGSPYLTVIDTTDWSVVSGTPTLPSSGYSAAFSPDGNYLAVGHHHSPYLTIINTSDWSVVSGTYEPPARVEGLAFSPDGSLLMIARYDGYSPLGIDTSDWSYNSTGLDFIGGDGKDVAFSPDGNYLAVSSYDSGGNTRISVYNTSDWSTVGDFPNLNMGWGVYGVAFSPDSKYLAAVYQDSPYLTVIDTSDWSVVSGTPSLPDIGYAVAFSPDGTYLAAVYRDPPYLTVAMEAPGDEFQLPDQSAPDPDLEWRIKAQ